MFKLNFDIGPTQLHSAVVLYAEHSMSVPELRLNLINVGNWSDFGKFLNYV